MFDLPLLQVSFFDERNSTFLLWSIIATFSAVVIHSTLIALGKALSLRDLELYARSEISNAFATLVIVAMIALLVTEFSAFSAQYFYGCTRQGNVFVNCGRLECPGGPNEIDSSIAVLEAFKCKVGQKAAAFDELNNDAIDKGKDYLFLMSQYIGVLGLPVFQGAYVTSWFKQLEAYRLIVNLTTNLLIASNVLIVIINYVEQNMLAFFLPVGLLLRAFHFTRGIGAFLISVALGMYFIFPVVYIITDPTFVKPQYKAPSLFNYDQIACYPSFSGIVYNTFISSNPATTSAGQLTAETLMANIASIYSTFLFHPFIAFAVTLVFIRYTMYLLGGEAQDIMRLVSKLV